MSSVERFAKRTRSELKVRPMLPFGAPFEIGLVGVIQGEEFSRRGTIAAILHAPVGEIDTATKPTNWEKTSGRDVKLNFLADGEASSLFPKAPKANARIEVSFAKEDSFLVSVDEFKISTLRDPYTLIKQIYDAYERGIWLPEYVLIDEIVVPDKTLVILGQNAGTNLLLTADATTAPPPRGTANIAGKFTVGYQTQDVLKMDGGGQPLFYRCYRVRRRFFGLPLPQWLGIGRPTIERFAADAVTKPRSRVEVFERV
jgi:hypothetical protein